MSGSHGGKSIGRKEGKWLREEKLKEEQRLKELEEMDVDGETHG